MISPPQQMAYILFLFFYQTEIEPCLPFAVLLAKSVLDETRRFEKCSHIPEKKLDTQKRGRKARQNEGAHRCAPCFSSFANAFAFPNLKVVSHVEGKKKARVKAGDFIFYGIPGSPCPLSISLSRLIYSTSPSPSAFPQLKTFDFPRRSIITKKKKRIIRANEFLFFFLVSQCSTIHERTREFRVRRLKKRDIHWLKILLFQKVARIR